MLNRLVDLDGVDGVVSGRLKDLSRSDDLDGVTTAAPPDEGPLAAPEAFEAAAPAKRGPTAPAERGPAPAELRPTAPAERDPTAPAKRFTGAGSSS